MIYFHWPFCESKCPYCDFNSHVPFGEPNVAAWRAAFFSCLGRWRQTLGEVEVKTVFFGGGTPSTMSPKLCADLLDKTAALFQLDKDAEITLEANPSSAKTLAEFKVAGVNRLSLGVQSFVDRNLRLLGRRHDAATAERALAAAKECFARVSFDMIYALPTHAEPKVWRRELRRALRLARGHVSLYQLTIEKGTEFYRRPPQSLPDDDAAADLYELTLETAAEEGLFAYEVSNFAATAADQSRHNLGYWRYQDFIGVGPGAWGRVTVDGGKCSTVSVRDPQKWLAAAAIGGETKRNRLTQRQLAMEFILMGLRLKEGLDKRRFKRVCGVEFDDFCDREALGRLQAANLLSNRPGVAAVKPNGWLKLEAVIRALVPSR